MALSCVILNLLIIVLIAGFSVLETESLKLSNQSEERNRPILITASNETQSRYIVKKSQPKTNEVIKSGLAILEATECGRSEVETAANGNTPDLLEFPWMALLLYSADDGLTKTPECDGSLISEKYVLTAAQCLRLEDKILVSVLLGEYDTMEQVDCTAGNEVSRICNPPVQEIDVQEAIYHKDFDPESISFLNDIGLVRLKTKATFRRNVRPICLPITPESKAFTKGWLYIAGWDRPDKDHKSNLPSKFVIPTIDTTECEGNHIFIDITEKHLCAGNETNNVVDNPWCNGDSGRPMFIAAPYGRKTRYVQYGIYSRYGSFCGSVLPQLNVKVEPYLTWIAGNIY